MFIGIDGYQAPFDSKNNKFDFKWAVVTIDYQNHMRFYQINSLQEVLIQFGSHAKKILIDEPLGLDIKERQCDIEAHNYLKVSGKVFRTPSYNTQVLWERSITNGILLKHDDQDLQTQQRKDTNHGLQQGAFGIMRYISEARKFIIRNNLNIGFQHPINSFIAESHPEVCFASYNNDKALLSSKKNQDGKYERIKIIQRVFPNFLDYAGNSSNWRGYAAMDDILDAIILALTARDIVTNSKARTFPSTGIANVDQDNIPIGMEYH